MRDMLKMALADAGFSVVQAEDGLLGLEALAGCKPDVIVTDINMPRMDGFQFIAEVRSNDEHRRGSNPGAEHGKQPGEEAAGARCGRDRLDREAFRSGQTRRRRPACRGLN